MKYACPQCGKDIVWRSENTFRPFCSERCQQIDLGAWAQEVYTIAGDNEENDASTSLFDESS